MFCNFQEKLKKSDPRFVFEFKNSYLVLADHQTFEGYSWLVLKNHYKELTDMPKIEQIEYFNELIISMKAVEEAFSIEKLNVSNYGNMTPHQHWHIFPRRKSDSNWPQPPWTLMNEFKNHQASESKYLQLKETLQKHLKKLDKKI